MRKGMNEPMQDQRVVWKFSVFLQQTIQSLLRLGNTCQLSPKRLLLLPHIFLIVFHQFIDGHRKEIRKNGEHGDIGRPTALPVGDRLRGNAQLSRQLFLGQTCRFAQAQNILR